MRKELSKKEEEAFQFDYVHNIDTLKGLAEKYQISTYIAKKYSKGLERQKKDQVKIEPVQQIIGKEASLKLYRDKIVTVARKKVEFDKLKRNIKPGMTVSLDYKEERNRKTIRDVYEKINIHKGEVIQVTDSVLFVKDNRGFRQGIDWNSIFCGYVKVVVA